MALRNRATPVTAAVGFVDHPSLLLRWALAARPDLPPDICARLAVDTNPGVRGDLAENPAVDDALIRVLATDRDPDIRRRLAPNPRVPFDVLTHLAGTTRIGATLLTRIAAASPAEAAELATSPHPATRMLLARRRDLPPAIRDAPAADSDAKVVKSSAPHPGLSEAQLDATLYRFGSQVAAGVAANPDATPALLAKIASHEPPARKALREIARHRHAPASALLTCPQDVRARPIAAGHPALPPAVIEELLTDAVPEVAEAAAANPPLAPTVMTSRPPTCTRTISCSEW